MKADQQLGAHMGSELGLETKFVAIGDVVSASDGVQIEGYASRFAQVDQGGDIVQRGAYAASLSALSASGRQVKMLWQHDPAVPIGVWDDVREDGTGLWVKGRLLTSIEKGREAAELLQAGAIDGLSIGYRTVRSSKNERGQRVLEELELWEVSLVTFPMLPSARVTAKSDDGSEEARALRNLAAVFRGARADLARR